MKKFLLAAAICAASAPSFARAQAYTQVQMDFGWNAVPQSPYFTGWLPPVVQGWATLADCNAAITNEATVADNVWAAIGIADDNTTTMTAKSYGMCVKAPTSINTPGALLTYTYWDVYSLGSFSIRVAVDTSADCTAAATNLQNLLAPFITFYPQNQVASSAHCVLP